LIAIAVPVPARAGRPNPEGPDSPAPTPTAVPAPAGRAQLLAFRSGQVWLTLAATALGYGGMFGAFSYIASIFTRVTGFSATDVAWLLVLYGCGLVSGNLLGGRAVDRDRDLTLIVAFAGLTGTLALLACPRPRCRSPPAPTFRRPTSAPRSAQDSATRRRFTSAPPSSWPGSP
jgi:DHA1 family inner membrane transport protein